MGPVGDSLILNIITNVFPLKIHFKNYPGTSLVVQWLGLHAPNAGGLGSIPGQGTRSHMHATTKKSACRN